MNWIKVTPETMPPEGEYILVTTAHRIQDKFCKSVEYAVYSDGEFENDISDGIGGVCNIDEVTHWMPMPAPAED